jgi:hypothetical protein
LPDHDSSAIINTMIDVGTLPLVLPHPIAQEALAVHLKRLRSRLYQGQIWTSDGLVVYFEGPGGGCLPPIGSVSWHEADQLVAAGALDARCHLHTRPRHP